MIIRCFNYPYRELIVFAELNLVVMIVTRPLMSLSVLSVVLPTSLLSISALLAGLFIILFAVRFIILEAQLLVTFQQPLIEHLTQIKSRHKYGCQDIDRA